MNTTVLSAGDVERFIEVGFVHLPEAIPRDRALAVQDFLWERLAERGALRADRATWTSPLVHLRETYADPVFAPCATARLAGAIEDLVGVGRWATRDRPAGWGWWPVNFALGADQPWTVPTGGWHWDGQQFRHHVDSPEQGLLLLCVFSDIRSHGGATLIAEGSHQLVAEFLAGHEGGLELGEAIGLCTRGHPWLAELTGRVAGPADRVARFMGEAATDGRGRTLRVVEAVAEAGDVFLCHPMLFHAASSNHLGIPRFLCNRTTPLRARLNLDPASTEAPSPLEVSVRRALGRA